MISEEKTNESGLPEDQQQVPQDQPPASSRVVGVMFIDGKVGEFDPLELKVAVGDMVVVDNDRDLNLGKVVFLVDNPEGKSLRRVIRQVGPEDLMLMRRNRKREEEAFEICTKRIVERKLPMKLIRVAYLHGGNKAIFYFSSDGRVDFRTLVRDLAQQLHVRIEMRQIGVRDESKMLGGIGICGQELCCVRFLRKFVPVSIKMAKNQNLALNPQKLSGLCGRLMCCLIYEDPIYRQLRKGIPKVGAVIETPRGPGKVVEVDVLGGKVRIQLEDQLMVYRFCEILGEESPAIEPAGLAEAEDQAAEESSETWPSAPPLSSSGAAAKPPEARERHSRKDSPALEAESPGPDQPAQPTLPPGQPAPAAEQRERSGKKRSKRRSRRRSRRRKKRTQQKGGDSPGAGSLGSDGGNA